MVELTLFLRGRSEDANQVAALRKACDEALGSQYVLSVLDVDKYAAVAEDAGITSTPALVRHDCSPVRLLTGDIGDASELLSMLGISTGGGPLGAPTAMRSARRTRHSS